MIHLYRSVHYILGGEAGGPLIRDGLVGQGLGDMVVDREGALLDAGLGHRIAAATGPCCPGAALGCGSMAFEKRTLFAAAQGRVDGDRDAVLRDADLAGQDLARDDPVTGAVWDRV